MSDYIYRKGKRLKNMEILDQKTISRLAYLINKLTSSIKIQSFFGYNAEMPAELDAKDAHELENIFNKIVKNTQNAVLLEKDTLEKFYIIDKDKLEQNICYDYDHFGNIAVHFNNTDRSCLLINKEALNGITSEKLKAYGAECLLSKYGIRSGDSFETVHDNLTKGGC